MNLINGSNQSTPDPGQGGDHDALANWHYVIVTKSAGKRRIVHQTSKNLLKSQLQRGPTRSLNAFLESFLTTSARMLRSR